MTAVQRAGHNWHNGQLDPILHQGQFGEHLVQLIVTAAGFASYKPPDLGDGVDLVVSRTHRGGVATRPPNIELQVKSTRQPRIVRDILMYDLEKDHFDILRSPGPTKRYLIVVDIRGAEPAHWIGHGQTFTVFHNKVYWQDLLGYPASPNRSTVAVPVPLSHVYTELVVRKQMRDAEKDFRSSFGVTV